MNGSCGATTAIPDDKILAPGVIDSCSNYLEHPELIAQRLERFIRIVGVDRVIGSTDCGFGTFAGYGKIDPVVTWKKLAALREGGRSGGGAGLIPTVAPAEAGAHLSILQGVSRWERDGPLPPQGRRCP